MRSEVPEEVEAPPLEIVHYSEMEVSVILLIIIMISMIGLAVFA